ncbi:hypothetical protein ACJMK2_036802, partial [Sinanodonta woodiana]
VHLDVLSGWLLGLGPCGNNCSRLSINSNTETSREEVLQKPGNSRYFGNWTVEFRSSSMSHSQDIDLSQVVYSSINESVLDVSEKGGWEQVRTVAQLPLIPDATYMDIVVLLDKDNYIRIATIDPDGDHVACFMSEYVEGGIVSERRIWTITVTMDCIVTIPPHRSLGYQNGSMVAVGITLRDYNVSGESGGKLDPFSAIGVQFLVQFMDNISEPIFIFPTPDSNQRFNIYYGTTWKIDVYAEPISPALIDHFSFLGRQHEDVKMINVKDTSVPNHVNVKMATMTWTPLHKDVGKHILCVRVEDSYGMDSSDQLCYVLVVKSLLEVNQSMFNPN